MPGGDGALAAGLVDLAERVEGVGVPGAEKVSGAVLPVKRWSLP